jgi:hypothetical protein
MKTVRENICTVAVDESHMVLKWYVSRWSNTGIFRSVSLHKSGASILGGLDPQEYCLFPMLILLNNNKNDLRLPDFKTRLTSMT